MSKYRRAAKIDANQPDIVKALRQIPGITVEVNHDDFLVGYNGRTYWFELKSPDAVSKKTGKILESEIEPDQKRIRRDFTGHYSIVSSLDEILNELNI